MRKSSFNLVNFVLTFTTGEMAVSAFLIKIAQDEWQLAKKPAI